MPELTAETDPARRELLDAAAKVVAEEGVDALTTRRLAAEVGRSTMAVYTWFGSKPNLLRALYREAFSRFRERLCAIPTTDDPLADVIALGRAYRQHALTDPNLYEIMFGRSHRYFSPAAEELEFALSTYQILVDAIARCVEAGDLDVEPQLGARQVWASVHGAVTLTLAGDLTDPNGWKTTYRAMGTTILIGLGADPERVRTAMARWTDDVW